MWKLPMFVLAGLLTAIAVGFYAPAMGCKAAEAGLSNYSTAGIFVLSGLGLSTPVS